MAAHRSLVHARVVGVNDGKVLYPCCVHCYAKLLHNLHTDLWQCIRCNIQCGAGELSWRYRLSLCLADSSAACNVSLFGGMLGQFFGCSANDFYRFIIDHHGDRQGIEEEVILHAVQTTLVGNAFIFCLKTATPPQQSAVSSTSVHKLPTRAQPLCLADLLPSQRNGGKQSDLVAVQMIRASAEECSMYLTILDVLKSLVEGEMNHPSFASEMSLQRAFSPNEEAHRSQTQLSISRRNSSNRRWTGKNSSSCLDLSHETNERRSTCAHCGGHHSNTCVTSASSSTDHTLSTDPMTSQTSLMFSCQSSMDQEFPSELSLTGASGRPGVRCSGGNSTLTKPRESKGDLWNESDFSFRVESLLSPDRGTRESLRKKPIPFAGGKLDDEVTNCETRSPHIVNSRNVCIAAPAKESVRSCTDFFAVEKENCEHLDSTLPDLGQSLTSISCNVPAEQPHSLQSCLKLSGIGSSFSSSLNDSSLLLGDVDANYCSLKTKQEKETQKEIEEEVRTARPHTGNVAQVFSRQCQCVLPVTVGEKTVASISKSRYVDMPDSENLSLFLEGMVSQDTTTSEPLSENSKGSAQQHVSKKRFHESEFVPSTRQQKGQQSNEKGRLGSHKRCRLGDSVESCDCHFGESRSRLASLSSAPRHTNSTGTVSFLVSTEADVTDCSERKADAELPSQDAFEDVTVLNGCGETRSSHIVNSRNVCIAAPAKESVRSCADFFEDEKENCVHLDSTLPDLGQSLTSISCNVPPEQPHSLQSCLKLSDIGSSFSSSLNDSSLLLGDVDVNYCSLKTKQEKETQKETEEEVRTARPHTGNVAQVFSRQCQCVLPVTVGEKTVARISKSRYVDMPDSENLSLFLEGMVSQDTTTSEPLSENSKGSAQQHVSKKRFHESEFVPSTRQQKGQQSNEKGRLGSHKRCRLGDSVESCDCHFGESRSRPASLSSAPRHTNSTGTVSFLVSTEADVTDCSERKADAELPSQDAFDDGIVLHGCGDAVLPHQNSPSCDVYSKQTTTWQSGKHSFADMSKKHASKIRRMRTTCLSDKHACVPEMGESSTAVMSQSGMEADAKCQSNLSESLCRQQAQDEQHLLVEQKENTVLVMPDSEDLDNFLNNWEWDTHTCHASQGTAMENRASYKTYHSYHDNTARKPLAHRQDHLNSKLVCIEEERLLTSDVKVASQQTKSSPPFKPGGREATRHDEELRSKGTVVLSSGTHKAVHRTAAEVHNTAWNKAHQVCSLEAGKRQSWEMSQRGADICTENGREAVCYNSSMDGSFDLFLSQGTNATDHGSCGHSVCSFGNADPPGTTISENNVSHVDESGLSTEEFTGDSLSSRSCAILEHSSGHISSRVTSFVINDNKPANNCELNKDFNYNCMLRLPKDPQRKKVRFSRRRRVSSVQAMDMRLEKYTNLQRNSRNSCLAETPTNTFDRSSVGQSVHLVNTPPISSGTPTISRSCLRLSFSPVTASRIAFVSNLTNHHLASMCKCSTPLSRRESTVQNSIQSDELTQSVLTPIVASARHSVHLLGSQEHIGSQDLFSPLSRDENNSPAHNQLPGTGGLSESYPRYERMQTDVDRTPCLKSAFGDCESPSSFDCSDTLFDNSESSRQSQRDQASCILLLPHGNVQNTVASSTVGGSESKNPVIAGSEQTPHSVTHFISASSALSPDLFSP